MAHPEHIEIIYPVNIRLPTDRASSIQIINTCHALASLGVRTHLCLKKVEGRSPRDCLAFYGLSPTPRLHIHRLPVLDPRWGLSLRQKSFFVMSILRLLTLHTGEIKLVYLRDLGLAYYLLRHRRVLPSFARIKIFYEVHLVSYLMMKHHQELMSAGRAPDDSRIEKTMRQERYVFQHADGLVAITAHLEEMLKKEFKTQVPIAVIPDGVRIQSRQSRAQRTLQKDAFTCAPRTDAFTCALRTDEYRREQLKKVYYIGQVYPWKGVDVLIRAMAHIEGAELIVVGGLPYESDLSDMKSLARTLGLGDKITFVGFVQPGDVASLLENADVAVVPLQSNIMSNFFTSPLKLFEYMAAGIPIVATNLPSLREVLRDGENAALVEPGNPIALAAGIMKVLNCGEFADRISAQALEDVQSYTWEARAKKIRDFVADLAKASNLRKVDLSETDMKE